MASRFKAVSLPQTGIEVAAHFDLFVQLLWAASMSLSFTDATGATYASVPYAL
jgi:hypothetical protein